MTEHLKAKIEFAKKVVATWPAWKRNLLRSQAEPKCKSRKLT